MAKNRELLYIFDLKNAHDEYARCLEFITILQGHSTISKKKDQFERIRQLSEEINIAGMWVPDHAKNYYEEPLELNGCTTPPSVVIAKELRPDSIQMSILDESPTSMQFHIRVHLSDIEKPQISNLSNLHYLALLLQRLDHILSQDQINGVEINGLKRRISVFIVPFSGNHYPFHNGDGLVDLDTYQTVSTYLRLLSKRYTGIIYGVVQRNNSIVVRALDFHRSVRLIDSFPLIPLDERTYPKLFEEKVTLDSINILFSLRKNGRVPGANDADPYKAFSSFIAETAYYHLKSIISQFVGKDDSALLKLVGDEVCNLVNKERICLLSLAIFMFTFYITERSNEPVQTAVRQSMEFAEELSSGLRQLAQNTLQHSACGEGVVSFYLEQNGEGTKLRVFLSDYNDQQTFVDNFIANLIHEVGYTDNTELRQRYMALVQNKETITLGHFFGEYGAKEPTEVWINFRQADTSAHIGLLLFAMTMQRCDGTVQLINSTEYSVQPRNSFFHCYASNCAQQSAAFSNPKGQIIPGSHLVLTIPVGTVEEQRPIGMGQLTLAQPIHETYESFAMYLDCRPMAVVFSEKAFQDIVQDEKVHHTEIFVGSAVANAAVKYESIYCWEKYWNTHGLADGNYETHLYYLNVAKLPAYCIDSADEIEIFIKGFVNAMDSLCQGGKPLLFAFTNVSKLFLHTFRQVTISLASKKFPSNLQLYVIESNLSESIQLLGDTFCQAISNAYTLSLEHGTQAYSLKEVNRARNLFFKNSSLQKDWDKEEQSVNQLPRLVCPFDVILPESEGGTLSVFDKQIRQLADHPMDRPSAGYKLDNIHMRLGSKIHIHAFYEMAFLFYRTSISNRIAFEILKNLRESITCSNDNVVDLIEDDLIFYGYASYSKALLTSILEILKAYRVHILIQMAANTNNEEERKTIEDTIRRVPEHLAFISYQHNLQSDFQVEDTELYFNFYNSILGERLDKNKVRFNRQVKIIQIVPISSTLTTFNKMETRIQAAVESKVTDSKIGTVARYTVFWVTDELADSESFPREETEAKYWKRVDTTRRQIYLNVKDAQESIAPITYFMRSLTVWEDPLQCELCYPENVIAEIPLVETDQTSTVPAQQLRGLSISNRASTKSHKENDQRLLQLKSCITYGHIRREKNHFQFYIETQNYFNRVNTDVQRWLENLRNRDITHNVSGPAVLNIIFSPEHATNVGFAQYVNNYYFDGNAEIVCVNEGKEYRSNFKCEHMALSKTIVDLLANTPLDEEPPIHFYFVDDTIITGETFHKAVSLLHSLIPTEYQYRFSSNLIRKCFLLVDRLSRGSKRNYVKDVEQDFLSFVHIDVSNMRVQGDSCVGCKLEINAKKLLKRSATRNIANYWSDKAQRYTVQGYSKYAPVPNPVARDKAFHKLVLSHITQNVFFNDNEYFNLGNIYDSILTILAKILGLEPAFGINFQYDLLMQELRQDGDLELLKDFLKLVSRPFFSFDFKLKLQVLTLLLIFAEFLASDGDLSPQTIEESDTLRSSPYKAFLFEKGRITETFRLLKAVKIKYLPTKEYQIDFFRDCILDGLVELRSTYMMRKETMVKLLRFLLVKKTNGKPQEHELAEAFWKEYVAGIHQILDCNSDETRALWLEYLLISGEEYQAFQKKYPSSADMPTFEPRTLFETLTENCPVEKDSAFFYFCSELFLQNNRVLFDGIESSLSKQSLESDYCIDYWKRGRSLNRFRSHCNGDEHPLKTEQVLFAALEKTDESNGQYKVTERYKGLLDKIAAMAQEKYGFERTDIALITCMDDDWRNENKPPEISQLDLVSCALCSTLDSHFNKYEIKKKLAKALSGIGGLRTYGYQLSQHKVDESAHFFVYFDSKDNPIVPVYLYFSSLEQKEHSYFNLMLLLRDILSYRNRLLQILKNDFAGDIFPKYAHTSGEKSILAHEKATSHNTTGDDSVTLEIFMDPKSANKYSVLDSSQVQKWLLLHNYTNAQIAKLFNRSYRTNEEHDNARNFPSPPPLYLKDVDRKVIKTLSWFERPLRKFSDLRLLEDGRITLLDSVVSLKMEKITNINFIENDNHEFYNVEYFKNILIDIIISAMKYSTASATYLERVDQYLEGANKLRHPELLTKEMERMLRKGQCQVECTVEKTITKEDYFDYLIIRNKVNKLAHNLFDWETHNRSIRARLENPIDYADGHMSLLAISHYIEGLCPKKLRGKTTFEYKEENGQLWFETKLPIIKKE